MLVLAGDLGGTSIRLGLFEVEQGKLVEKQQKTVRGVDQEEFRKTVADFLQFSEASVETACFGVAGPVSKGRVELTNLGWRLDAASLASRWEISRVVLLNDLEAAATGLDDLEGDDYLTLHEGHVGATGNRALISPGTGLGEATLYWDGKQHRPLATEGGHASFAPENDLEIQVLEILRRRFEHVSWERVLSGPGLVYLALALAEIRDQRFGDDFKAILDGRYGPAAVVEQARAGTDAVCEAAVELFVLLLAAEAGNLALKTMARGGVFIGGGIPPRLEREINTPKFLERFLAKGRMRGILEAMPVKLVVNDKLGLLGAARGAATAAYLENARK
jgi:glucokinase